MAWVLHNGIKFQAKAPSSIGENKPVRVGTTAREVFSVPSSNHRPDGFTVATVADGDAVAVHAHGNFLKAVAAASLGYGSEVIVASTNGDLGPFVAGASGVIRWTVGVALEPAAAGETFTFYFQPRETRAIG